MEPTFEKILAEASRDSTRPSLGGRSEEGSEVAFGQG